VVLLEETSLNSNGTILTDKEWPYLDSEFGAYMQAQKKLIDDRFKINSINSL